MTNSNVLGIDVAKDTLIIFDQKTQNAVTLNNTETALEQAVKEYGWQKDEYIIGLESTGDYSFLVMQFFVKLGFKVKLLNPIVTKRFIKSTVRNKKTDRSDAEAISLIVQYGEGQDITEEELKIAKKTLIRTENRLIGITSDLKRIKKSLEKKISNGLNLEQAIEEIDQLIAAAETSAKKIWQLSKEEKINRQEEIISSHIGCGEKLSAIISTEAGDIKRFPTAKQFKAYAGIDPKVFQSGNKDARGSMTKRGNPLLRYALYLAAFSASMYDPELKVYYRKKRDEGKSHRHALCIVSRKMCERIHATVIQDRLYVPKYPQGESLT